MKIFTFLMLMYLGLSNTVFGAETISQERVKILKKNDGYLAVKIGQNNAQTELSPVYKNPNEVLECIGVEIVKNRLPLELGGRIIDADNVIKYLANDGLLAPILEKIEAENNKHLKNKPQM
jgi:hypothetical protein